MNTTRAISPRDIQRFYNWYIKEQHYKFMAVPRMKLILSDMIDYYRLNRNDKRLENVKDVMTEISLNKSQ